MFPELAKLLCKFHIQADRYSVIRNFKVSFGNRISDIIGSLQYTQFQLHTSIWVFSRFTEI